MILRFGEVHLTFKNVLSVVVGFCVLGLAVIPLAVPIDHLTWMRWQAAILALACVAVVALVWQATIQSREDHEREEREKKRDERQEGIETRIAQVMQAIQTGKPPDTVAHEISVSQHASPGEMSRGIDGEVYRIAMSPRSISWELVRDVFASKGGHKMPA